MKIRYSFIVASLFILSVYMIPDSPFAQQRDPGKQTGEIGGIDLNEEKRKDPYEETQNKVIAKLASFSRSMGGIAQGNAVASPKFTEEELRYLAAVHLWCTLRTGACTYVLDALLEADLVNELAGNGPTCSNLIHFWKVWLDSDMNQRLGFDLQVGHFARNKKFNQEERPKYLNCVNTVENLRSEAESDSKLLQERYKSDSRARKAPGTLAVLLKQIRGKIRNMYIELGLRN